MYSTINECRICKDTSIVDIINFGNQPLANSLKHNSDDKETKIPLTLTCCKKSNHIMLKETVTKDLLFSNYIWVTGTASSTKNFSKKFAQRVIQITDLKKNDFLIEIASNDGTFLLPFKESGFFNVLGVDPAKNLKAKAEKNGIKTVTAFWNSDLSHEIVKKYGKSKVIIARNVLPHVSELFDVVLGIKNSLREDGVAVIEFHYAGTILEELHYDSVYHEHLNYFSLLSISNLFEKYSLFPFHADPSPISGGGFVLYLSSDKRNQSKELLKLLEKEEANNINTYDTWRRFSNRCLEHKKLSRSIVNNFGEKKIIGFGSSARSSTYINFCEFNNTQIDSIIDNNILKHGKFTPGSSIPIVSLGEGLSRNPVIIFLFAWNFKNEIMSICRNSGYKGDFILPFPEEPRIAS